MEVMANAIEIDLLLTDVVLYGGMDGTRIHQQAKEQHPDLRCLFMSGYAALPETTLPDGADLLAKPIDIAKLAISLRSALAV